VGLGLKDRASEIMDSLMREVKKEYYPFFYETKRLERIRRLPPAERGRGKNGIRWIWAVEDQTAKNGNNYHALTELLHMAPVSRVILKKYLVDVGLGISFFLCFTTGILKLPGFVRFFHRASIEFPLDQASLLHDASGVILGIFALVHLALNRRWLVRVTRKLLGRE
jgi:hypothetical protein